MVVVNVVMVVVVMVVANANNVCKTGCQIQRGTKDRYIVQNTRSTTEPHRTFQPCQGVLHEHVNPVLLTPGGEIDGRNAWLVVGGGWVCVCYNV